MWYFPNRPWCLSNCHNFFLFCIRRNLGISNQLKLNFCLHSHSWKIPNHNCKATNHSPTNLWGGGSSTVLYTLFKCQISTESNRSKHVLLQLDCEWAASIIRFQLSSAITQDKTWYTKTQFTRQLCKTENPWFNSNPTQNPHRGCSFQNKKSTMHITSQKLVTTDRHTLT